MKRFITLITLLLLCIWACNKEALSIKQPTATSGIQPSVQVEATYDSAVNDLYYRIMVSEAQLAMLRRHTVVRNGKLTIISASEPVSYQKICNPPE
jgi:hypothetical protein